MNIFDRSQIQRVTDNDKHHYAYADDPERHEDALFPDHCLLGHIDVVVQLDRTGQFQSTKMSVYCWGGVQKK